MNMKCIVTVEVNSESIDDKDGKNVVNSSDFDHFQN